MDLDLLSHSDLVSEGPCMIYAIRCPVHCRVNTDDMGFTSTLIQYLTHTCVHMCTHIQHTQGPIDWHMYGNMLPPPVVFTEAITVSHRRKTSLKSKIYLANKSTVRLFFKITHMLNLHICRLDWIRLSPNWEIQKNWYK